MIDANPEMMGKLLEAKQWIKFHAQQENKISYMFFPETFII